MAGQLVPLVLIPRYTTLAGLPPATTPADLRDFVTTPIDVTPYQEAYVTTWRGALIGTAASPPQTALKINLEESSDQQYWTLCDGCPGGFGPLENEQLKYTITLTKRWLRLRTALLNADNIVTCYAVGFLRERFR